MMFDWRLTCTYVCVASAESDGASAGRAAPPAAAERAVGGGAAPAELPLIQSVVSLAGQGGPAAGRHPSLVLVPPPPVSRRNVRVQTRPRDAADPRRPRSTSVGTQTGERHASYRRTGQGTRAALTGLPPIGFPK